jgi:lambda family phage tail tape measure protein
LAAIFGTLSKTSEPIPIKVELDKKAIAQAEKEFKERMKWISAQQNEDFDSFKTSIDIEVNYDKKLKEKASAIYEATREPFEKLNVQMAELDGMLSAGQLDWDTYSRAIFDAYDKAGSAGKQFTDEQKENMRQLQQAIDGWGKDSARAIADFALSGKGSFSDFANSVVKDIMTMMIYQNMTKPLMSAAGSWMSGLFGGGVSDAGASSAAANGMSYWAKGGAFDGAQAFANGGTFTNSIVNSPTAFKFANGGKFNLGVMGEAGAEAVMPLTRIGGKLGVLAQGVGGGGGTNVVVNVMNSAGDSVQANARQSTNSNGDTVIDVMVDRVKGALLQDVGSNGQFSQAFSGAYGLSRRAF